MQNVAISLRDNPLQWETERQNRMLQEALEQKKKLARGNDASKASRFIEKVTQDLASAGDYLTGAASHLSQDHPQSAAIPDVAAHSATEYAGKVRRIPGMRSAWIPLDETTEGGEWSMPFSLPKADMEPWRSFLQGYYESRVFLEAPAPQVAAYPPSPLQLDFAVRAILELKRLDTKVMIEPPVQINGQVEYLDLDEQLRTCPDALRKQALAKMIIETHDSQLQKAVEKGREMGNRLYDALMGEGHANLIRAWENAYKRKPSIEELHLMLTTGRATPAKRQPISDTKIRLAQEPLAPVSREAAPRTSMTTNAAAPAASAPLAMPQVKEMTPATSASSKSKTEPATTSLFTPASDPKADRRRRILLFLFHASAGCAALIAYAWFL